jgi:riboflavin synthase
MFTGIIQAVGKISAIETKSGDVRLCIDVDDLDMSDVRKGDSIAVNGVCLTAMETEKPFLRLSPWGRVRVPSIRHPWWSRGSSGFTADVSSETLARTTLGSLRAGDRVNLEKALTPSSRLGGHIVSGHVDGVGELLERQPEARSVRFRFQAPAVLARYIAARGSICVDGVSLTVNTVAGAVFDLNAVPHSLQATILDDYRPGQRVNLEVDLIARYLERLLLGEHAAAEYATLSRAFLAEHGFLKE